jgi:hypothetical protein
MSRHRVGLALPVGMKGKEERWTARPPKQCTTSGATRIALYVVPEQEGADIHRQLHACQFGADRPPRRCPVSRWQGIATSHMPAHAKGVTMCPLGKVTHVSGRTDEPLVDDRAVLRPTDRYPHGPRPACLDGACLRQEAGLGRAGRGASAIGRDAGRRPAEAPRFSQVARSYRDNPRSRARPRASAIVIVRSRTLISMSLPRIFSSSGRHGTRVNS